jgi:MoaA/NifB/PqqE/SkfB family radical SAM enzyme
MPGETRPAAETRWVETADRIPRLPLRGAIDLTYRCNSNCRHCWLRPEPTSERQELSLVEIRRIADDAQAMGCREWSISGGEPMLHQEFADVFDYLTRRARGYTLNTNGTLITPAIARLLRRKGSKLVALYGATAEVHDHITRTPGSFEALMNGCGYLKEAGAGFTVQLVPMRDNFHEYDAMVELAQSLSPHYRVGAAWLCLSASGSSQRNAEIARQRLDPKQVVALDPPDPGAEEQHAGEADDRVFAGCIAARRDFHIDPFGRMGFCAYVIDPELRYDLRRGTFREAWDEFIPALGDKVRGGSEYRESCGSCELRADCRWCGVYGYLEHGRYGARVEYLCEVARQTREFRENRDRHRRWFSIAGITLQVESDLPLTDRTFDPKFGKFEADGPGSDTVVICHHFGLPDLKSVELGREVYRKPPWAIYDSGRSWVYLGINPQGESRDLHRIVVFSDDHTRGEFFHPDDKVFRQGGLHSVTMLPTDQILLAPLLADRQACYIHSAAVILGGKGLLFVGHSEAGKSTAVKLIQNRAEVLCDDRNIVRREPGGFRLYGSWSHGEVPLVSPASAPLRAILFLEKSEKNRLVLVTDRNELLGRLLACLIRPLETRGWWEKTLSVVEALCREIPCYIMEFDTSGRIVHQLEALSSST